MSTPADTELALLRRRLYERGASEADVGRYRDAAASVALPPPEPAEVRAPRFARRVTVRVAVPVAVLAAAVLFGAVVVTATPVRSATTPIRSSAPAVVQPVDDSRAPVSLHTSSSAEGASLTGVGPGSIPLDRSILPFAGGRISVTMLARPAQGVAWRVDRLDQRMDWTPFEHTIARGTAGQELAPVGPVRFDDNGVAPTTIEVRAPAGVRWWLDLRVTHQDEA